MATAVVGPRGFGRASHQTMRVLIFIYILVLWEYWVCAKNKILLMFVLENLRVVKIFIDCQCDIKVKGPGQICLKFVCLGCNMDAFCIVLMKGVHSWHNNC